MSFITDLIGSSKAASATKSAANTAAEAQKYAAEVAAEESRPRYLDFNDLFGQVDWTLDENGRPTGLNVDPSQFVQGLFGDAGDIYGNYYNLLSQYFQPDLQSGGSQIYNEWQNLLAPTRQTQQSQLFDALQAKGITGIEGYDPRTGANVNPYAQSLFGAWGAQDAQMASQAMNEYINRLSQLQAGTSTSRGDLVGVGSLPYTNTLNTSAGIASRAANPAGADLLSRGLTGAANTQAQGAVASAAYKNNFWNSLGSTIGNPLSGLFSTQPAAPIVDYGTPAISQQQSMLDEQWNPSW